VNQIDADALLGACAAVSDADIEAEIARDHEAFDCQADAAIHVFSVRVGLALRRMLEADACGACSVNFLAFRNADGPPVPFLEISKAMARGIGYGGEGDVLTASLVGALAAVFPETTFTEVFCPDWHGNSLFLSHMGEINPRMIEDKARLTQRPFPYTPAPDPAVLVGPLRPGPAVYANLAPGPDDSFSLILAPVEILQDTSGEAMANTVRGWIRPAVPVADFLEAYALLGGTHHSALVSGERLEALCAFAAFAGIEPHVIG